MIGNASCVRFPKLTQTNCEKSHIQVSYVESIWNRSQTTTQILDATLVKRDSSREVQSEYQLNSNKNFSNLPANDTCTKMEHLFETAAVEMIAQKK